MVPITRASRLNARRSATVACASDGMTTAESRLIGYHRLRCTTTPYTSASTAIAAPPTTPPLIPAEYGWISTGTRVRCAPSPMLVRSTAGCNGTIAGDRSSTAGSVISSVRSSGRTSRHQPTAAISARAMPTQLTTACVTSPANARVIPSARTIGQAVGAGSSTLSDRSRSPSGAGVISGRRPSAPGAGADK